MAGKKTLSEKSRAILNAVMNAIIPRGEPFTIGAADLNLTPRVEEILTRIGSPAWRVFPLLLYYVQYSTFLKTRCRFTDLTPAKAGAVLAGMETSPFLYRRLLIMALKALTVMVFFERDEISDLIGYDHGCSIVIEEGKEPA